jgi:hypothetical protein
VKATPATPANGSLQRGEAREVAMADRRIRDLDDLNRLSDEDRKERKLALRALREARRDDVPVDWRAEALGIDVDIVRRWAPDALESGSRNATYARDTDSVIRFQPLVVEGEVELVPAEGPQESELLADIFAAQYGFVNRQVSASALRPYEGLVLPDGREVTTDPEVLKRVAIEDPYRFLEIYGGSL